MTFVVIALERVDAERRRTQALTLAPTRVAVQSHDCFVELIEKFKESDDARGGFRRACLWVDCR